MHDKIMCPNLATKLLCPMNWVKWSLPRIQNILVGCDAPNIRNRIEIGNKKYILTKS